MNIKFTQPPLIFTCTGNGIIQNFISESLKQHYKHVSNSIKDRIKISQRGPEGGWGRELFRTRAIFSYPLPFPPLDSHMHDCIQVAQYTMIRQSRANQYKVKGDLYNFAIAKTYFIGFCGGAVLHW